MASLSNTGRKLFRSISATSKCVTNNLQGMKQHNSQAQTITHTESQTAGYNLISPNLSIQRFPHRKLFTPLVLNLSDRVKHAMLMTDPGIRHAEYVYAVDFLRSALLRIARTEATDFTVIPVNGSGTLAMESTLRTMLLKKKGTVLVLTNGWLSQEAVDISNFCGLNIKVLPMDFSSLRETLLSSNEISGVVVIHCESFSGLVNPVEEIGETLKKISPESFFVVDATMTFGSMAIDMSNIDFLVSDSCKSLQGAPGMAFVLARKEIMERRDHHSDSLVMDLTNQYLELEKTGELRFTPPIHIINALKEAVLELSDEGGVEGRANRYKENNILIKKGMADMGFAQLYTDEENPAGYISTAFRNPHNPLFVLEEFRSRLNDYGFVITESRHMPKKSFCVGNIGNLDTKDVAELIQSIRQVCQDMRMSVPICDENY